MGFGYFDELNYTLANEDPSLETEVLGSGQERVVAVGGSGARILPLLSKSPKEIHIVDISRAQLALCELRIETIRKLSYEEFLRFWYPLNQDENTALQRGWRKECFSRMSLDPDSASILERRFQKHDWDAITLTGKWEKTFRFFSKLAGVFLGAGVLRTLFSFKTLEEQRTFLATGFPRTRFRALVRLAGSAKTFNALLYRGSFPKNNSGIPYVQYYEDAFFRLFTNGLARENFFLQLSLLGRIINREALPLEADPRVFSDAKAAIDQTRVFYHHADLITVLEELRGVDFVSFSNVPAYFGGELERTFLARIRQSLNSGARLVIRHYLHYPEGLDRSGYTKITGQYGEAMGREKVQMYDPEILECRL